MSFMKKIYKQKIDNIIEKDPILAERTDIDNNNVSELIYINSFVRIFKLVITILNITIFVASFVYIIFEIIDRIKQNQFWQIFNGPNPDYINCVNNMTFIEYYSMNSENDYTKFI